MEKIGENSGLGERSFPVHLRALGDRSLHRQVSRLPRPWDARRGEVFCIEAPLPRERRLDGLGFWRGSGAGVSRASYGVSDLPEPVLERVSSAALMLVQSEDVGRVVMKVMGERAARFGESAPPDPDCLVCLSFWGGLLVVDECGFVRHPVGDGIVPEADFGFGLIWAETPRLRVPEALLDIDVLLGTYICERLYPAVPDPVPTSRTLGLVPRYLVD